MIEIPETESGIIGASEEKKSSEDTSVEKKVIGSFFEDLRLDTFGATPGPMEFCKNGGKVISFKIQYEVVKENWSEESEESEDNTAMNSICFLCSGNDTICSHKGTRGEWHYSDPKRCHNGFSKVRMRVQEYQVLHGYVSFPPPFLDRSGSACADHIHAFYHILHKSW